MPLSNDPHNRQRQLSNLTRGAGGAGPDGRRAVSHGAYAQLAPERVAAKVRQVLDALTIDAPVRERDGGLPAADSVVVRQLAEALVRLETISDYLDRRGWQDDDGMPRPVLEYEGRLRGHVLDLLKELGMTPASRTKLGLNLARTQRTLEDEVADSRGGWDRDVIDGTEAADAAA